MPYPLGHCLVLGGGGFLGQNLTRCLLQQGYRVRVFGRHHYQDLALLGAECIQGDVQNLDDLRQACQDCKTVFHTVAICDVVKDRQRYYDVNVKGTQNVLTACRETQVSRLVFTSTPSVIVGSQPIENGDETLPYPRHFTSPYSETKALAEQMVLAANGDTLKTCALRPHLMWGNGEPHILPVILKMADKNRLRIVGDGTNLVSITHVNNAAYAHILAAEELAQEGKCAGSAYFVHDTAPVVLWDWINTVLQGFGRAPLTHFINTRFLRTLARLSETLCHLFPFAIAPTPILTRFIVDQLSQTHTFTHEKATRDFGYSPIISPEEGLGMLLNKFS